MAVVNSSTFNFKEVMQHFLRDYCYYDVMDVVTETVDEVSKETVKKLRAASKSAFGNGQYAKGWTRTIEKGRLTYFAKVHGKKPTYYLAHLLEYGHTTRNGTGRVFPDTPGREHIAPINDWAQDEAMDRIVSKLEDLK